jgi:3-mercaptopyruvate sulfurtransferase SseA
VFAAVIVRLGVGDDRRVVPYDPTMSMWAARVWWMLRWLGFDNAFILDGGWQSGEEEGRRTSSKNYRHPAASLVHSDTGAICPGRNWQIVFQRTAADVLSSIAAVELRRRLTPSRRLASVFPI